LGAKDESGGQSANPAQSLGEETLTAEDDCGGAESGAEKAAGSLA